MTQKAQRNKQGKTPIRKHPRQAKEPRKNQEEQQQKQAQSDRNKKNHWKTPEVTARPEKPIVDL